LTKLTYKKNVYLLSDEVMSKIVYDTAKWYGPSLENRNVVVVSSFSKTWFVPGIRLGWMATKNVELIQKCNDAIVNQSVGVNLFSQLLMTYACQKINYAGFLQKRFDILVHRKNLVKNLLNKYGIGYLQNIEGGMNYYIDLKKDSSKIALELFQKYKIALIPGELFEGRKSTFARFGFGAVKKEEIIKGINVLAQEL
ncbi:pyridoxal phosphate-dependent aminotransferase, partial [Candidatus Roizmanbacteria bacterium]|nr:pyridoxal phosphate-dependent aminotransferase [Candidatus Roizmanbacteria bacterium]